MKVKNKIKNTPARAGRKLTGNSKSESRIFGPNVEERLALGKALRDKVSRASHAKWAPGAKRKNPLELLRQTNEGRIENLLPIRYGRMRKSPFAFFRGAAAIMAADLATTPETRLHAQLCGDCHLLNFGGYASPERRIVFDINDFDETLRGPWEWDVKRLAASIVLSGRESGLKDRQCGDAAQAMVASYRVHMREYAQMRALDAWYSHLEADLLVKEASTSASEKYWQKLLDSAALQTDLRVFPKLTHEIHGKRRFVDNPPLVYHPHDIGKIGIRVRALFLRYRATLPEERRVILDRYHVIDIARKVVGVGSVGTRCDVALLMAGENDPLFIQLKQALPSALDPYAGTSRYKNQGERVVTGQRMLQAASDVFLGWARDDRGHDYYFRQLRDMKMKFDLTKMSKEEWLEYIEICGWTLARAHARTGDAATIGGYLGKGEAFDAAIATFAEAYADQTERDHALLVKAIRAGRIPAHRDVS
ncbi:MAG TPA: DUF2252 domain-containing protein [Candidatus Acidoferrales bacterium]